MYSPMTNASATPSASLTPSARPQSKSVQIDFTDETTVGETSPRAPDDSLPSYAKGTKSRNTTRANSTRKVVL